MARQLVGRSCLGRRIFRCVRKRPELSKTENSQDASQRGERGGHFPTSSTPKNLPRECTSDAIPWASCPEQFVGRQHPPLLCRRDLRLYREDSTKSAKHAIPPRGLMSAPRSPQFQGRFGRLFRSLQPAV